MNTPTTHPVNLRARYKRVAQALEPMGIQAVMSEPSCCGSCAVAETAFDRARPYLLATRIDHRQLGNSSSIFDRVAPEGARGFLAWHHADMTEGDFLVAVIRALRAEGFEAEVPDTIHHCIVITAGKEVTA